MHIPGWQIALFVLAVLNSYVVAILGVNLHNRCLKKKKGCDSKTAHKTELANILLVVFVTLAVVGGIVFMIFGGGEMMGMDEMAGSLKGHFGEFFSTKSPKYYYACAILPFLLAVALIILTAYNAKSYSDCRNVCARHPRAKHTKHMLEWWGFVAAFLNLAFFAYNIGMGIHLHH